MCPKSSRPTDELKHLRTRACQETAKQARERRLPGVLTSHFDSKISYAWGSGGSSPPRLVRHGLSSTLLQRKSASHTGWQVTRQTVLFDMPCPPATCAQFPQNLVAGCKPLSRAVGSPATRCTDSQCLRYREIFGRRGVGSDPRSENSCGSWRHSLAIL